MTMKWLINIKLKYWVLSVFGIVVMATFIITVSSMRPVPEKLSDLDINIQKNQYLDRNNNILNVTFKNNWNIHNLEELHNIPKFLQQAMLVSEDKRFYDHNGVDWLARLSALKRNVFSGKSLRGASTISEQVIKMLHPRPRTVWTKWLEGLEAGQLEGKISKQEILEFYLNQVPYAAQRRGVRQAASYYFNRDLSTLNKQEMLALAIMVRAPKWLNPFNYPERVNKEIVRLAERMALLKIINKDELAEIKKHDLETQRRGWHANTEHFLEFIKKQPIKGMSTGTGKVFTTLDIELQKKAQKVLDEKLSSLQRAQVKNGAVLIVDHQTNDILAWVVGKAGKKDRPFNKINSVLALRQPGSTLKPFLYALALEKGWTAASMLNDEPLDEGVGLGMHSYHNYSRQYYGLISLRESLGNSLNIPAVRTIQQVGVLNFLDLLNKSGIKSLIGHPNLYGDGLALGNGEVTLFELVQAYTTLARMGNFKPLSGVDGGSNLKHTKQVIKPETASLIANILSDPKARSREFGVHSILNFSHQTAIKTGTSSDYRDAWGIGYNDRYTIGVWFGNLDYTPMQEITGSSGPVVVLRSLFNELNRGRTVHALYHSPRLEKHSVCVNSGLRNDINCHTKDEWFIPGTINKTNPVNNEKMIRIRKPTNGLKIAMDPRVPDEHEIFEFEISNIENIKRVEWLINDKPVGSSNDNRYSWQIKKGVYSLSAIIYQENQVVPLYTSNVNYSVQ